MPLEPVNRYFVDIRLAADKDTRKSLHIDACSRTGALHQCCLMLMKERVRDIYAITVRAEAYPVAKRKRLKLLKQLGKKGICKKNNKKTIQNIKNNV